MIEVRRMVLQTMELVKGGRWSGGWIGRGRTSTKGIGFEGEKKKKKKRGEKNKDAVGSRLSKSRVEPRPGGGERDSNKGREPKKGDNFRGRTIRKGLGQG